MNINTAMSARMAIAAIVPNEPEGVGLGVGREYIEGGGYMGLIGT
jgi:hypothetical protein